MSKDCVITNISFDDKNFIAAAYYKDDVLSLFELRDLDEKTEIGSVYQCKAESYQNNINATFVNIGGTKCYLPGKKHNIGEEFPVQISKDPVGNKLACVSDIIEIPGRYTVVSDNPSKAGILSFSGKISKAQKTNISPWFNEIDISGYKIIVRTNAIYTEKADVLTELENSMKLIRAIKIKSEHATCFSLLYSRPAFYIDLINDIYNEIPDRIRTDRQDVFTDLKTCFYDSPELKDRIELYMDESFPLTSMYNMNRDLGRLVSKKVYLKSGAYLVIEKTEAFVSIDVNSGKNISGRIPEETYRKINIEAGQEIARQLSLRNLSGMILVDFINMKNQDHITELLNVMKKKVKYDHVRTTVVDITPLGIMEITRHKESVSLEERLKRQ